MGDVHSTGSRLAKIVVLVPGFLLAAVLFIALVSEAWLVGIVADPEVLDQYSFGKGGMVLHGGWTYVSASVYTVTNLVGAGLFGLTALLFWLPRFRRRWLTVLLPYLCVGLVSLAFFGVINLPFEVSVDEAAADKEPQQHLLVGLRDLKGQPVNLSAAPPSRLTPGPKPVSSTTSEPKGIRSLLIGTWDYYALNEPVQLAHISFWADGSYVKMEPESPAIEGRWHLDETVRRITLRGQLTDPNDGFVQKVESEIYLDEYEFEKRRFKITEVYPGGELPPKYLVKAKEAP